MKDVEERIKNDMNKAKSDDNDTDNFNSPMHIDIKN